MPRTILIADDKQMNREVLANSLRAEYALIEAEDGAQALEAIRKHSGTLSAALLDIDMPEMDGYGVLSAVRADPLTARMPIIMVTGSEDEASRVKALTLGANDFIVKPYNPDIILHCLKNNIALSEMLSTLDAMRRDALTGLYNRETFFGEVAAAVSGAKGGEYVMSCFDIDNFKLINERYGAVTGDAILRRIGVAVRRATEEAGVIAGRISADNFALLYPVAFLESGVLEKLLSRVPAIFEHQAVALSIGRYVINDPSLAPSAIYDRAYIAKQSVKGRYDAHLAYFDEVMLARLVLNQQITGEMESALASGQFEVWFQPQYDHGTKRLIGAEALARWRHPQKGIVPPGDFIPLFEQNGFVYELDKYIWRETCRYLRKWLDAGLDPAPVSVNVSRYDLFRADLTDAILSAVGDYGLDTKLLRLEITESAFSSSTELVVNKVKELIGLGFTVGIDDFGSGYSSLNTLKDVPAQVVKLDMRFLEGDGTSQRGGSILESVVRMARWLGMKVLAEGVEELAQADFLSSVGCSAVQGYLYARPMPAADYEALGPGADASAKAADGGGIFGDGALWDPGSLDTLVFNSYSAGACVYEYRDGRIDLIRVSERYARTVFGGDMQAGAILSLDWSKHIDADSLAALRRAMERAIATGEETTVEYTLSDLPNCPQQTYLRSVLHVIASAGDRHLVYCTGENITVQRLAEQKERDASRLLELILSNIDSAVQCTAIEGGRGRVVFANGPYFAQFGCTKEEYERAQPDSFSIIHPDDRERAREIASKANEKREPYSLSCRIVLGDGTVRWRQSHVSFIAFPGEEKPVQLAVTGDVTALVEAELHAAAIAERMQAILDNVTGVAATALYGNTSELIFANDRFFEIFGYTREAYFEKFKGWPGPVIPEDMPKVLMAIADAAKSERPVKIEYRAVRSDGALIWIAQRIASISFGDIDAPIRLSVVYDITDEKLAMLKLNKAEAQHKLLINSIPGGIATYEGAMEGDKMNMRLAYFSDGLARLFGYTREEYDAIAARDPISLVFREDAPALAEKVRALIKDGVQIDSVHRTYTKSGGYKWVNFKASEHERLNGFVKASAVVFDVTAQQEALERLRVSEEEMKLAIAHSRSTVCRYDVAARSIALSPGINPIFGISGILNDVPYGEIGTGRISPETEGIYTAFYEGIMRGETEGDATYQRMSEKGWRWIEAHYSTIFSDAGKPVSAVVSFVDATDRLEKEALYNKWQQSIEDRPPESYSLFRCSVSSTATFGISKGLLLGIEFEPGPFNFDERTAHYARQCVHDEDAGRFTAFLDSSSLLGAFYGGKRTLSIEYREKLTDGHSRFLRLTVDLVKSLMGDDVEAYLLFEDIDELKRAEMATAERAQNDPLTGVFNRKALAEMVDRAIGDARPFSRHALLMLDIDGFKLVNDMFGHAAGDQALIDIAEQLRTVSRRGDIVGRLGGDEFVIFLCDVPDDGAAAKAKQICSMIRRNFSAEVRISASVGIAVYPRDGVDFETLYKRADETLYAVKGAGRNSFAFYKDEEREERQTAERASAVGRHRRRMLIVDDSRLDFELLANMFSADFTVERAMDGTSALMRLRHYGSAVSVVLLDLLMPGMSGIAVLEKMRASTDLASIPVIAMSGNLEQNIGLSAIRAGAADFVMKPIDPEILRVRVASAVSKAENERLRAKNSYLEFKSEELERYSTVLDRLGLAVAEYDHRRGTFEYSPSMENLIFGRFDGRGLWHILLSDLVADVATVKALQRLAFDMTRDRSRKEASATAKLKTPAGEKKDFRVNIYKIANEYGLTEKLIITFEEKKGRAR